MAQIYEVPSRGGQPQLLFEPEETEKGRGNFYPYFLPRPAAARSVLVTVGSSSVYDLILKNLETGESQTLAEGLFGMYSTSGHIVFEKRDGGEINLWALPFALDSLRPTGEAFPIAESGSQPSVSEDGTLVFVTSRAEELQQLVWRDRDGTKLGEIGQPQPSIKFPVLSPDGRHVAVDSTESGNRDVWVHEVERPMKRRLTFYAQDDTQPQWSPSGREIAFQSNRRGSRDIFHRVVDGTGEAELLAGTEEQERPYGWSRNGKYLVYSVQGQGGGGNDLWYLKRKGDGEGFEAVRFLKTPFYERAPHLSPNGRFIAYCSNDSGEFQVYVRPFPSGGGQWQVSSGRACQPRWGKDGKKLFFVEEDTLMAVDVTTSPVFAKISTTPLFSHAHLVAQTLDQVTYDVSADGRFVLIDAMEDEQVKPPSIHVTENWYEEFRDHEQD